MIKNKIQVLEALEIPLWIERPKHANLFLLKPRAYARVWVVLSKQVQRTAQEIYTIYRGMLKVLEISESEISYAIVKNTSDNIADNIVDNIADNIADNETLRNMINTLKRFSPENILILGKALGENWQKTLDSGATVHNNPVDAMPINSVFATYHPEELALSPHLKKEAYRVLLSLKEKLHNKALHNKNIFGKENTGEASK